MLCILLHIPKDYTFKKDKLVLLWMAEGFLPQHKNKTRKKLGMISSLLLYQDHCCNNPIAMNIKCIILSAIWQNLYMNNSL
jgi:hypothetical protein